jgi:hypothetical protein
MVDDLRRFEPPKRCPTQVSDADFKLTVAIIYYHCTNIGMFDSFAL